jgi:hypothetical protein
MTTKIRGVIYEIISEVILITSIIFLSTLFANDLIFNKNILENPSLFGYVAFGGIILSVLLKLLAKSLKDNSNSRE